MGLPAAKQGDRVQAIDTHIVLVPSPTGPVPVSQPFPFNGIITGDLCPSVLIEGRMAAVLGSTATNIPPHIPVGGTFAVPPTNQAQIVKGSATVIFGERPAARAGDRALTCNDPAPLPSGTVLAQSSVLVGG